MNIQDWDSTIEISPEYVGVLRGVPNHVYHATGRLSTTKLKYLVSELGGSPMDFYYQFVEPVEVKKPTTADIGTLIHALLLEGRTSFEKLFKVCGYDLSQYKVPKSSKAFKDFKIECEKEGLIPLLEEDVEKYTHIFKALDMQTITYGTQNFKPMALFGGDEAELSLFCDFPGTNVPFQIRVDKPIFRKGRDILVDLKTTGGSIDPKIWKRAAYDLGFHIQAYIYPLIWEQFSGVLPDWFWFVIKQQFPHRCNLIKPSQRFFELGKKHTEEALETYEHCLRTDNWSVQTESVEMDLPYHADYLEE